MGGRSIPDDRGGGIAGPGDGATDPRGDQLLEHIGAIEADFLREYRLDLWDQLERGLSWRRFLVLLAGLSTAAVWRLIREDEGQIIDNPAVMDALFG